MHPLNQPMDLYCERLGPGLLAEPLNLISNLAFFIAAVLLLRNVKKHQINDAFLLVIISMVAVIWIGSSAFHSIATFATMMMDVIPIAIYLLFFIAYFCLNIARFNACYAAASCVLFLLLGYILGFVPKPYQFNGTISYFPALIFLIGMVIFLRRQDNHIAGRYLQIALLLLVISMTFRSIDMWICPSIHIGSHFMWHMLNGGVLYFSTMALFPSRNQAISE